MKSFTESVPLITIFARRQLHVGRDFPRFSKKIGGDSKATTSTDDASKDGNDRDRKQVKNIRPAVPSYSKNVNDYTKVSAAVRASCPLRLLPEEDIKSLILIPEEHRSPTAAETAASTRKIPSNPKRSELDQRKLRRTQCAKELKELVIYKKAKSAVTIKCMPFVKIPQNTNNEQLMAQESDPLKLANAFISLRTELIAEKAKSDAITQDYLELRKQLYLKDNELLKAALEKEQKAGKTQASSSSTKDETETEKK
ncbi:uncharacterized protein LOC110178030 [Drosophila serrata]|uniref:uncharacterized protein LOC110178030 n=1 Tax=Drosophila serrata TaxID=7274 RepID=UPI000A1D360A|nr:uncharacterized protein LOC110178030 [Drosophila serrata]XP_020800706.1 uncharacterized protein LOC110178030 [Drosophila serrata]